MHAARAHQHVPSPAISIHASIAPSIAGTTARPRGVRLALKVAFATGAVPIRQLAVTFPQGNLYRGSAYPSCAATALEQRGPGACPQGSLMGIGAAIATGGGITVKAPIVVVNGGAHRVLLYVTATNPVALQAVMVGSIATAAPPSSYLLTLAVPSELQDIAGIPVALQSVQLTAGRGDWLASDACPDGSWRYLVRATLVSGAQVSAPAAVPCR